MVIKTKPLDNELSELRQLLDEADQSIDIAGLVQSARGYWLDQCEEYSFEELTGYADVAGWHQVAYCNGISYWFNEWLKRVNGTAELIDSPKIESGIGDLPKACWNGGFPEKSAKNSAKSYFRYLPDVNKKLELGCSRLKNKLQ